MFDGADAVAKQVAAEWTPGQAKKARIEIQRANNGSDVDLVTMLRESRIIFSAASMVNVQAAREKAESSVGAMLPVRLLQDRSSLSHKCLKTDFYIL